MYARQPKKMLAINILNILQKYTDAEHVLSQKEIKELLETEFDMTVERKAVKRNLMELFDSGYNISCTEKVRKKSSGESEIIYTDWYYVHDFEESELRLLIDSVQFSKHISNKQSKELIEKLEKLSSKYFQNKIKHIKNLSLHTSGNQQLFYVIEILSEAMEKNRKVKCNFISYDIDKKKYAKADKGKIKEYILNPYQMVIASGQYYLMCSMDKYKNIINYRLDHIHNIELLDEKRLPLKQNKGTENGLDLPKYMAEHIYMFSGDNIRVKFRAKRYLVDHLIDGFGIDITFGNATDDEVDVVVTANKEAMYKWCIQYMEHIEVLSPKSFRKEIKVALEKGVKKYE
jgi:hypothetical protein